MRTRTCMVLAQTQHARLFKPRAARAESIPWPCSHRRRTSDKTLRDPDPTPLSPTAALALARAEPVAREYSALGTQPFLLLHLSAQHLPLDEQQFLADWLQRQPCPVLGIEVDTVESVLSAACDVRLRDSADAALLLANIRRTPIAAAVLVQLLRAVEHLPLESALVAESLAYSSLQAGPEFRHWLDARAREPLEASSDPGPALLLTREDSNLRLTLNRPSTHNAMTVEMRDALVEALQLVLADPSIESVEIDAIGRCFSTGGELREFGTAPDPASAHLVRSLALPGRYLAQCAARVRVVVHGACIGSGIEFPAFAATLAAQPDAYFQLPELRFGLIPGAGGCSSITRRIGRQRTAWLVLSGKRIDPVTARAWGLVDAVL